VVDTLGELVNIYAISDIVILGGAFEPIGGHNAAEAAQFGCKIISGKHYFNQKDIFEAVEGIAVVEASNLSRRLSQHGLLKPTKIRYQTDIRPIIESLRDVL
jgi:3-deoxy-D-manno-octulosonic-acid transferase